MALPAPINRDLPTAAAPASDPHAPGPDSIELVKAQLFGILHLAPAPDAPAFVKVGDTVHPGQTLCILEAMKTFHEVRADRAGTVDVVFFGTGQEVESGDVLFRLVAKE